MSYTTLSLSYRDFEPITKFRRKYLVLPTFYCNTEGLEIDKVIQIEEVGEGKKTGRYIIADVLDLNRFNDEATIISIRVREFYRP